ncbi:MAG: FKBP-type peptidyl-prolyl cis-trans isomerase [Polyangiaceae bacterium]|jgi:peptidylprolyl isomerase|nr:FKBP-type peptidyl-prolyl cis-trans isomerase [Polyangiaceae bacterium]
MRFAPLVLPLLLLCACETKPNAQQTPIAADSAKTQASSAPTASAAEAPPPAARPRKPDGLPPPEDVAAPPADASKTPSGLASKVITKGTGKEHPGPSDKVKVHYTGWTADGKMFDSSVPRGEPTSFGVDQVIKGWTEGLQLMVVGEKRRFWIPAALAYGERPMPGTPAGQLTFDVELLDFTPGPKPPPVPSDVKAAPPTAKKTASGLAYRVLSPGKGKTSPKATDVVTVHYTGWTPDGKMFDSSVTRGEPTSFPLDRVIKGWTEGVQLMKQGDKFRFWIPSDLAYGDKPKRPGAPAGPLVFDVELLEIKGRLENFSIYGKSIVYRLTGRRGPPGRAP